MKRVVVSVGSRLVLSGIVGFLRRRVTRFGTGAKVDCPKEFLGRTVYLVFVDDGAKKRS